MSTIHFTAIPLHEANASKLHTGSLPCSDGDWDVFNAGWKQSFCLFLGLLLYSQEKPVFDINCFMLAVIALSRLNDRV
jgi:hypothetical protein